MTAEGFNFIVMRQDAIDQLVADDFGVVFRVVNAFETVHQARIVNLYRRRHATVDA